MPPLRALVWTAGADPVADALVAGGWEVRIAALPAARATTAAATAASQRRVVAARRALGELDAVVVLPRLAAAPASRLPGLAVWRRSLAGSTRAAYIAARAAALALTAQRRGSLVVVIDPAPAGDAIAVVAGEQLRCLVDALRKAVPAGVTVSAVDLDGGRRDAARVAASVRHAAALAGARRVAIRAAPGPQRG